MNLMRESLIITGYLILMFLGLFIISTGVVLAIKTYGLSLLIGLFLSSACFVLAIKVAQL